MSLKRKSKTNFSKIIQNHINLCLILVLFLLPLSYQLEKDSSAKQISKVNLLLPICQKTLCNQVYAKLIAYNGCFDWRTDDPNLVQLEKIQKPSDPPNCFSEVYVYTKSKSVKEITYVSAKDRYSNEIFKCKVGFSEVKSISIENNFDSINIGDIFELHVLAHDEKGNIFSSLEGWKFNWKIISGHNNAQLIKLTEHGKMEMGDKREKIEKEGYHSDKMLIKGSQTGKVLVNVEIVEENLKTKILSNQRELYVIEPFKIIPDKELYIMPNTQYNFDLMYIHSKKIIPSSEHKYFKWSVTDENCGRIKGFGYFYSKDIGCTVKVVVKDTRLEQFNTDEVIVHVLYPNNIDIRYLEITEEEKKNFEKMGVGNKQVNFNISPTFKLVEGKNYIFKNYLLYDDEPIYYDYKRVKFNFDLSTLYNYVHRGKINFKDNNELAFLLADKVTLEDQIIQSSVTLEKNNTLIIKKNVIIYEKLRIKKFGQPYFTLPYLGTNSQNLGQELYLIVTGGTGNYIYSSSNPEIVETMHDTYLVSKNKGKANIVVIDNEMNSNKDEIDIYVKDINSFTFMEERQEILIGNQFGVTPIALQYNKKYEIDNIFTNCTNIKLNYELSNHNLAEGKNKEGIYNINNIYKYYPIRDYIQNNLEALNDKLNLINIKNNTEKYEYMNYSNFGICGIDSFLSKEEGLLKILYKGNFNYQNNINTISSLNPANIYIYSKMEIKDIITDNFTQYILHKNKIENPDTEKNYILTEGSGVELNLIGGVKSWSGYQNDYIEDKLVIEYNNNENTYSADKVSKYFKFIHKKEKVIYAYCYKKGYEYDFIIKVHNKKDTSLINPGESTVHFKLSCYNPDHLSMYLLSQTNNFIKTDDFILNEIFNEPQKSGISYFVKKNSTDIVRIYGFDKNKKIFANITSLKGNFDMNKKNKNYFTILDREKVISNPHIYLKENDVIDNIYSLINQEFIQDYILFNEIESNSENNNNNFQLKYYLKNKINSHYANIQMIDVPEIYPRNASIYVYETNIFPLTIEKGSGDFTIQLNDESLAKYNYDKNNRKLYITPLRQGILIIKVIDNQLGTGFNYETKSTLYLGDISRILLYGGGLLMNNKSTMLGIEVYDTFDNKFNPDQQQIIPLKLNESFYGLDYSFSKNKTYINITGLVPGLYPIIIKDDRSEILSNIATIEVFEKLNVYPPYLLLVPGSEYTLEITGGPKNKENVIINYEMLDPQIANVSSNSPKVYGAKYGETKLIISLIYKYDYDKIFNINDDKHIINKTDILCVEHVPVRVDFPDSVVIIGAENNRKIYSKSTIRLLAALKKGNEVFTYGIGPFKFNWKVDNTMVAKIRYFMRKELYQKDSNENNNINQKVEIEQNCEECETLSLISTNTDLYPEKSIGVFLTAMEEGSVSVSLTVSIYYPSPYVYHKPYQFSVTNKIIVNDEVYVDLPGFYGDNLKKTGLYLIPYNVDHELHTNKNSEQIYSIIRQHDINDANNKNAKIISMTDNGRITSYFRNGLAYISISQLSNKDNNVPVILPILVSEFYSIFIEKTHTIIDMEVGQEILLKIIIQHYNGLLFAEKFERLPLKAVVSHPNVANVELIDFNSKIKLKAQNIGSSNIILFHPDNRKIYDVFKLNVVQQTTLLNKIVISVGGNINFFGKDLTKKNELTKKGDWISDNPKILKIDKNGYGTAINEGDATVYLKEKNSQKILTSTRVLVRKISKIAFDKEKLPKLFTDIKKSGVEYINEYKVPIILYSNDDEVFTNDANDKLSLINQRIKIKCESDYPNYVKADEINKDNKYECSFVIRENKFGENKKREQKPKDIVIQLTVEDYNKNKNIIQESIPFSSSFKIKNNIHNINLSFRNREYSIYVDNLNDLDIKLSNDHLVKIEKIDKEKNMIKIKVPYSVDEEFKGVILYLANVLTGQKEEININYSNTGTNGTNTGYSLSDYLFFIVFTILLILVTYFLLFSERRNPNQFFGNNNNFNNYNPNPNPNMMNYNGRGYPPSERRNFNLSNNMRNDDYLNSNNGSPGFRNMMRSNYNDNFFQRPRGSAFNNQDYGRFSGSNINMNNNIY